MDESQRIRYSRQIRLREIGEAGQQRLLDARILIIGMGGLGSPAAMYLTASGVGHLVVSDFDRVEASNLQRQIAHRHADLGESKASSARSTLEAINPGTRVEALDYQLGRDELLDQTRRADVVLDCTDNFQSRFELNRACLASGTPWVSGAAVRWTGQVASFVPGRVDGPCFRCLYPDENVQDTTCEAEGIVAPLVGIIGSMQALEAVRLVIGEGPGLCGRLVLFDGLAMEWQDVPLIRRRGCKDCSGGGN